MGLFRSVVRGVARSAVNMAMRGMMWKMHVDSRLDDIEEWLESLDVEEGPPEEPSEPPPLNNPMLRWESPNHLGLRVAIINGQREPNIYLLHESMGPVVKAWGLDFRRQDFEQSFVMEPSQPIRNTPG